jgi:hypothetical protein
MEFTRKVDAEEFIRVIWETWYVEGSTDLRDRAQPTDRRQHRRD